MNNSRAEFSSEVYDATSTSNQWLQKSSEELAKFVMFRAFNGPDRLNVTTSTCRCASPTCWSHYCARAQRQAAAGRHQLRPTRATRAQHGVNSPGLNGAKSPALTYASSRRSGPHDEFVAQRKEVQEKAAPV